MSIEGILADLKDHGIERITMPGTRKIVFRITCACGEVEDKSYPSTMPPEAVIKYLSRKGWQISRKHPPVCKGCLIKEKEMARQKRNAGTLSMPVTEAEKPTTDLVVENDDASTETVSARVLRQVYALLDQHFDEENGRYAKEWSDQRIARELGIGAASVASVRLEAYGDIKEDPAITSMKNGLEELRKAISSAEDAMLNIVEERLKPLRDRAAAIESKIAAFEGP